MPASSSSAPEPEPLARGTTVAGFCIVRVLGRGSRGIAYEATQPALDRRVVLKVVPAGDDPAARPAAPEHPHVLDLYAVGTCEHGRFFAMQLVHGQTLRERHAAGRLAPQQARDLLTHVEDALRAAHAEGLVHGAVNANNVLVADDGWVWLSDFAMGPADATPARDRAALAALRHEYAGTPARRSGICRAMVPAAALASLAVVLGVAAGLTRSDAPGPPSPAHGARALGSALAPGGVRSVDCTGRAAGGASPACTVVQTRLPARRVAAALDGAIREWTVRGARGDLALQVVRERAGRFETIQSTPYVHVADTALHNFPADLTLLTGEHVGVELAPGSAVGIRRRTGAAAIRFSGPLDFQPRRPDPAPGVLGAGVELLLRIDYVPGARRRLPGQLSGPAAARAAAGHRIEQRDVELAPGRILTVAVVRVARRVVLDLFRGRHRVARIAVPDADARGALVDLRVSSSGGSEPRPTLRWRNSGGAAVVHTYRLTAASLEPLD
jgi:hypothetical protein